MVQNIKQTAKQIVDAYLRDENIADTVDASPEPIRAMIYETRVVENAEQIDGTPYFWQLMDEIELIY